jgi:hypothetical protein
LPDVVKALGLTLDRRPLTAATLAQLRLALAVPGSNILHDVETDTVSYKPPHNVTNRTDLLAELQKFSTEHLGGILVHDLKVRVEKSVGKGMKMEMEVEMEEGAGGRRRGRGRWRAVLTSGCCRAGACRRSAMTVRSATRRPSRRTARLWPSSARHDRPRRCSSYGGQSSRYWGEGRQHQRQRWNTS